MKKLASLLIAATLAALAAIVGLAGSASATGNGDQPDADNKKVTFCHYAGSNDNGGSGNYVKLETSVAAFYNAGHIDHTNDIWAAFSYVTKAGDTVNVPAQGDQSLLAFEDCQAPKVDEKVAKPEPTFADPCGTKNDVFAVAPGRGYTVGAVQTDGVIQVINVTLNEGFAWLDGSKDALRFERPAFTDVDCDLPDTGVGATFNTTGGYMALGALALGGVFLVTGGRRKAASNI